MNFENFNNTGGGRGTSPRPYAMCMRWPWLEALPEWVEIAGVGLRWMFTNADRRWNEAQTKRRIIAPILEELLQFPKFELTESPDPIARFGDNRLHPDYYLPGACVIEAKRLGVSLLSFNGDASRYSNPLDQALTYLDNYPARSCMVTNGYDWYAFWNGANGISDTLCGVQYFGARFRLDEIIRSGDRIRLGAFLSMFNATCLSGQANGVTEITDFKSLSIARGLYEQSNMLYFADSTTSPMRGRGSGFCPPSTPDEGGWPSQQ